MLWMTLGLIEKYGIILGVCLVFLPPVYDVLMMGFRCWQLWQIHTVGIITMLAGGLICLASWYCREWGR